MDFVEVKEKATRNGILEIYPNFKVKRCKDLMVRGKSFYAVWDEERGMWSTDEYDVQRLVDKELMDYKNNLKTTMHVVVKTLGDFSSGMWTIFQNYVAKQPDSSHPLDEKIIFLDDKITKTDYVSKRLSYSLNDGDCPAYNELMDVLYSPTEREKIEWAIGAIFDGDAKDIQKFIVLYGEAGTGKSTVLNIIQKLFEGYYTTFEAKALTSSNNSFATEVFRDNPLVAIQHDGDLSKIEDNTKLNSIVSHEYMTMNEKYKASYTSKTNCFLFMGTNKPVKITDAKSGIIRRLIDVKPTGNRVPPKKYQVLMSQINFELGSIAKHCLDVYHSLGKNYYSDYVPMDMILQTDVFFNFIEYNYDIFKEQDGTSLSAAYAMYKQYCDEALIDFKLPRYKFREELKNYFKEFDDVTRINGKQVRSYYSIFLKDKIINPVKKIKEKPYSLTLDSSESIFDKECADCKAQYASKQETPLKKWEEITSTLSEIDTHKLHFVRVPENHIVIDFDIKDENGNKSLEKNIEAASKWPPTYSEISKGGNGLHLHYIYDGDPSKLSKVYDDEIEVKVFSGNSSLRRKLTKCNNIPIAHISSGLPLKGDKMVNFSSVKNEKILRLRIQDCLEKKHHGYTKPEIDYILKILDDAYSSGMSYDVTDLRPKILAFANNSSHQSDYCIKAVTRMKFQSDEPSENIQEYSNDELVFYDVEVFPNLFLVNWKFKGKGRNVVRMINPKPTDIEELLKMKLVGFNCRRYDNHILYARYIGYDNKELFNLSQRIIKESKNCMFKEAYNISYTDVYDFCAKKQSLKKWEIELGIHHQELGLPWDQDVPEELWEKVAEYCDNDVIATEAVFDANEADFVARQILADISGLSLNDTTNQHTTKIIFGDDPNPQSQFVYTDLSTIFPGYTFEKGKSLYLGEEVGEGGYVYAEPGMYTNVFLLDIQSMHPTSIEQLNLFGPYTERFSDLKKARILIKHEELDEASKMFDGKLKRYLDDPSLSKALSYALKIAINSVYGLTSAKFDNKFKDPRNIDNIVAKRGALFMINLKNEVQKRGYTVAHIKTDSIKIPNASKEIIDFVMDYGKQYGYIFEHEATYDKMCLINNAVYIAKIGEEWTATGAEFAHPYVFKKMFSKEKIEFEDLCETKSVTSALYLLFNEDDEENKDYHFVGKVGSFCPIAPGKGGGLLLREKNGEYHYATGAKGYRWMESEMVKNLDKIQDIDKTYFRNLVDSAIKDISKFGDYYWFISDEEYPAEEDFDLPWYNDEELEKMKGAKNNGKE